MKIKTARDLLTASARGGVGKSSSRPSRLEDLSKTNKEKISVERLLNTVILGENTPSLHTISENRKVIDTHCKTM